MESPVPVDDLEVTLPISQEDGASTENIMQLASQLARSTRASIKAIGDVNNQVRMLSFNASIEAARAGGTVGQSFQVVASAMRRLSDETEIVTSRLTDETMQTLRKIEVLTDSLSTEARGRRLTDYARNLLDIVESFTSERYRDMVLLSQTPSVVDAMSVGGDEAWSAAKKALKFWLDQSPWLLDLWLVGPDRTVLAQAAPRTFRAEGLELGKSPWFRPYRDEVTGGARLMAPPGEIAEMNHRVSFPIGIPVFDPLNPERALGSLIAFVNWMPVAERIVTAPGLSKSEREITRVVVVSRDGTLLADTQGQEIGSTLWLPQLGEITREPFGARETKVDGVPHIVAHAVGMIVPCIALVLQDHSGVTAIREARNG
jgi:hypothetical protein